MITRLVGFDLETTGVDVATCEVVQAAYVCARDSNTVLCRSRHPIPMGATHVHGLYDERSDVELQDVEPEWTQIPEDEAHFSGYAGQLMDYVWDEGARKAGAQPDTALVTFNGIRFDVPIWERIAGRKLRVPHIDVYRLHLHAKAAETECEHVEGRWPASVFAGSLQAAHVFWTGRTFEGAHDAIVDVRATLDVLQAMTARAVALGHTSEAATRAQIELSSTPLPGDVDFDGKFAWSGEDVVLTIGKVKGKSIRAREVDGFLRWMLTKDFGEDTKAIARGALRGEYPSREQT